MTRILATLIAVFGLVSGCARQESMQVSNGVGRKPAAAATAPVQVNTPHYVFGFAAPFGPEVAMERARTVSSYLSRVLDRKVEPRLYDYDQLADALADGSIDFAFMTPIAYVKAAQKSSGITLMRQAEHRGSLSYRSVFFVRADSPIQSMNDARDKRLAWIESGSASGRTFPEIWFREHDISPESYFTEQLSMADHSRVCQAVYDGQADVGASFTDASTEAGLVDGCTAALGEKAKELRIIAMTDPIPNDVVAARMGLPQQAIDSFGAELDRLMATDEGMAVLNKGFQAEAFFAVNDDAFDPIRRMLNMPTRLGSGPVMVLTQAGVAAVTPLPR